MTKGKRILQNVLCQTDPGHHFLCRHLPSPHEHQEGLKASIRIKFTRHVVNVGDLHGDPMPAGLTVFWRNRQPR